MENSWRLLAFAVLFSGLVMADNAPGGRVPAEQFPLLSTPQQSAISFRSALLPKWSFDVRHDRAIPYNSVWIDTIALHSPIDSIRLSASRTISSSSHQRIFASVQASNDFYTRSLDWLVLPGNAGVAASVGWFIGEVDSLNMAVEYEYREVGETDVNSLNLGVHYYF
ncbi:hypothetical protein [Alteromonas sp. H39]|uniref:hypothetical protein n=1 Tax=Alteromonas sp. H39 TaxID=3389876 RepID=UPI0039DF4BD5